MANVLNVVNANITNSNGLVEFLNLLQPYVGNIDLSNLSPSSSTCATCSGGALQTTSSNDANVTNNVSVTAASGGNTIAGAGPSTITTGNAGAAANVVNVVNTNITNSQYLLLVLNNFTQMQGDLVLPGKSFFDNFFNNNAGSGGNLSVTNTNNATVNNNVTTVAATGGNTVTGAGSSTITTGNANAATNVVNEVNQNSTGGTRVYLLINVPGSWAGNIFSTPPGLKWETTPDGLLLTGADAGTAATSSCGSCSGTVDASSTNNATVENNVQVYALTGNNEIDGNKGSAAITTGNAVAATNIVNLVNTNIVGQNVLFAIVNVLGDWKGNIAFGQPDLWTGVQANLSQNPLLPDNTITYTVTVTNRGTADATNVVVTTADSDPGIVTVTNAGGGTRNGNAITWDLSSLAAGASHTFTYQEKINNSLPFVGKGSMTETVSATETEDDANPADNADRVQLPLEGPAGSLKLSHLFISEANNATSTVPPGSSVHYAITLGDKPWAGPASNVFAHEILFNPEGTPLSTSTWVLGNLEPGNKFRISYDASFATSTPTGWYISEVSIDGRDVGGQLDVTKDLVASSSVYVVNPADYKPKPAPMFFYYWFPTPTSTPTSTVVGKDKTNVQIQESQDAAAKVLHASLALFSSPPPAPVNASGPSCAADVAPVPTSSDLLASIGSLFAGRNGTDSFTSFLSSSALTFGKPFFHFW